MDEVTYPFTDDSLKYANITQMLRQVMADQAEIKGQLGSLISMRDAIVGSIQMDSMTLELVLEVSDSTLYRWRQAPPPNCLPYYHRENGAVYYFFDEVLKALRKGQLNARGFNRLKAIERMVKYREDLLNSKDGTWL